MSAFALDPVYNDFAFTQARMTLVTGAVEFAQKLNARFGFVKGEWFLDTNQGTPWFQAVLGFKNPSLPAISRMARGIIVSTPGAKRVDALTTTFDRQRRIASIANAIIEHDSGAVIVGGLGQPFIVDTKGIAGIGRVTTS